MGFFFNCLFFAIFSAKRLEACSSLMANFSARIKSYKIFRDDTGNEAQSFSHFCHKIKRIKQRFSDFWMFHERGIQLASPLFTAHSKSDIVFTNDGHKRAVFLIIR